ncbi:TonB-dependent receptor domain-containing protein [Pedobacter boryungensis]|uniref:TonB-dependent receptor n=1 Tax=Pedobacter boryungensis TaxID=869962 RepID=A0ABX2DGE3_9SPHI|nr:TonB-dependent receptor [Pedobacter boryungensis]NQX33102.1 TonB-dependent receptor [Pedobacter boryungensis]
MKRILLLSIGLIFMLNAKAQFPGMGGGQKVTVTGRINAIILDSLTNKPVDYATVSLLKVKDGKAVNGGVTDEKGKIVLQNVAPDEYKLTIGFMGYKTKTILIKTTPEKPDYNVGSINLSSTANTLKEVSIVGQKAVVENKIDRLVYNAEADATNAGGDATDVMRKVPMLSVDINGNVQLRGSSVRVLINGKPSGTMANSVADALKMLPADQIKSVEVITNPSAKYDAEGSGGIINIITKKSNAEGVSGSVNATTGTRQNAGAFNLTAKTGRFSVNTALGTQIAYPQESRVVFFNQTTANNVTTGVLQDGTSDWTRQAYNGSLGLDYDFNAYNNISTNAKYTRFYNGGPGSSAIFNNNTPSGNIISSTDMSNGNLDWNMDYKLTTKKPGEEFSISGQLTTGKNTNEFVNDYKTASGTPLSYIASNNVGENKEYTAQTDYIYPFSKTVTFEAGGKAIFRNIQSQYGAGQDFDYTQNVGAAYSTIAFNLTKKIQFKGGLRAEYTDISSTVGKNDYFNLFPSAILSQTIKGKTTLKLAYNRRVQRPSLAYLNPFLNKSNLSFDFQGNPDLAPELSDNFEFGYSTYIKGSIINASIFYRNTQNIIEALNKNVGGRILSTFENVGTTESYGFNLFASYNPLPKWTLMSNIAINTYEIKSRPDIQGMNEGTFLNYNFFMRSANSFKGGWSLELFGVLNSPRYTYQSKTEPMVFYGAAVKKDILNKKGTIGLNVLNPFKRDLHIETVTQGENNYQSQNIYYPLRSFGLNFSYKFGKLKFTEKKKIKNDDIKQDQNQQGGQMGGVQQ